MCLVEDVLLLKIQNVQRSEDMLAKLIVSSSIKSKERRDSVKHAYDAHTNLAFKRIFQHRFKTLLPIFTKCRSLAVVVVWKTNSDSGSTRQNCDIISCENLALSNC
jgi:hypothetical protein